MNREWLTFSLFLLGILGLQASVISNQDISRKKPGKLQTNSGTSLGIYNGKSTYIKKHPYMAAIMYFDEFFCAGTIISERWVLTSADCIYGFDPEELSVVAGSADAGASGRTYTVEDVEVHPDYGLAYLDYNYGLLRVNGQFRWSRTVRRARLPRREPKVGSRALIVGWGETERLTGAGSSSDNKLREGNMEFLSRKKCGTIYQAQKLTFTDRLGCTYNQGKVTPCDDDWGDPLIQKDTVYQIFIAVGTTGECTSSAYPAINADVLAARSWIRNTTGIQDEDEDEDE